jgi:UPF0042 nucleotide-binding protein
MTRPSAPPAASLAVPAQGPHRVVLVTGPSGAGRSTAIRALDDLGFEAIDNLPLSFLPRLARMGPHDRPMALGLDVRNRDFGAVMMETAPERMGTLFGAPVEVLFLDCSDEVLLRRFSETRRPHPLSRDGAPEAGLGLERALLAPLRERADIVIDTSGLSPHELRAQVERWFAPPGGRPLAVTLESFSYKQGLPPGLDIVMDCRFLRNPHWNEELRPLDGRDPRVAGFVQADPRYEAFYRQLLGLLRLVLPATQEEGKAHLAVGIGCTGGKHRSVTLVESLAQALAEDGWRVSKRHRQLERRAEAADAAPGART